MKTTPKNQPSWPLERERNLAPPGPPVRGPVEGGAASPARRVFRGTARPAVRIRHPIGNTREHILPQGRRKGLGSQDTGRSPTARLQRGLTARRGHQKAPSRVGSAVGIRPTASVFPDARHPAEPRTLSAKNLTHRPRTSPNNNSFDRSRPKQL